MLRGPVIYLPMSGKLCTHSKFKVSFIVFISSNPLCAQKLIDINPRFVFHKLQI